MAKEIFISYSRKDFDKVKAIKDEIDRELGIKCWMDLDGIESGEQFENKIITAINDHNTMLFMLSTHSMNSIYALKELKFAQLKKKRVILVYIESCQMSDEFLFNYSMYDTVEWANSLQHDKLLKNLRQWFGSTQQTEPIDAGPTDPKEQFQLGEKYYSIQAKYDDAVRWYRRAAEQGYAPAQNNLGMCFYNGKGVPKDYGQAVMWCRKAAEQGHANAQYNLGFFYYNGKGVSIDYEQGVKWYRKAAEQGHTDAQYLLGKHLIKQSYYHGNGSKEDDKEAFLWFMKAAEKGHIKAQYYLGGFCYKYGYGVAKNYTESIKWLLCSAEHGDAQAQNALGDSYEWGRGVEKDMTKAIKWYEKSAEQGNRSAVHTLAYMYLNGWGVPKDFDRAATYFVKLAKLGDKEAIKWLEEHNRTPL